MLRPGPRPQKEFCRYELTRPPRVQLCRCSDQWIEKLTRIRMLANALRPFGLAERLPVLAGFSNPERMLSIRTASYPVDNVSTPRRRMNKTVANQQGQMGSPCCLKDVHMAILASKVDRLRVSARQCCAASDGKGGPKTRQNGYTNAAHTACYQEPAPPATGGWGFRRALRPCCQGRRLRTTTDEDGQRPECEARSQT